MNANELRELATGIGEPGDAPMHESGFEAINLDDCTTNPEVLRELADVFGKLETYAKMRAHAFDERYAGSIQTAQDYERICDHMHQQLPEWARW
jgi:hypothetical protein